MNHIYKIVWNKARECYMVVCEYAKSQTKGCSTARLFANKRAAKAAVASVVAAGLTMGVMGNASAATVKVDANTTDNQKVIASEYSTAGSGKFTDVIGSSYSTASGNHATVIGSGPATTSDIVDVYVPDYCRETMTIRDGNIVAQFGPDDFELVSAHGEGWEYGSYLGIDHNMDSPTYGKFMFTRIFGKNYDHHNVITASGENSIVISSTADAAGRINADGERSIIAGSKAVGSNSQIFGTVLASEVKDGAKINKAPSSLVKSQPTSIVVGATGTQYAEVNNFGKSSVIMGVGAGTDNTSDVGTADNHGKVEIAAKEFRSPQDSVQKRDVEYATIIGAYADNRHSVTAQGRFASIIGSTNTNAMASHTSVVGSRNVDTTAEYATTIGTVGHTMGRGPSTAYSSFWDVDTSEAKIINDSIGGVMIGAENRNPGETGTVFSGTANIESWTGENRLQVSHGNVMMGAVAYDGSKIISEQVLVNDGRTGEIQIFSNEMGNGLYELTNGYSTMMGVVARDNSEITTDASNTTIIGSMTNYSGKIEVKGADSNNTKTRFATVIGSEAVAGQISIDNGRSSSVIGVTSYRGDVTVDGANNMVAGVSSVDSDSLGSTDKNASVGITASNSMVLGSMSKDLGKITMNSGTRLANIVGSEADGDKSEIELQGSSSSIMDSKAENAGKVKLNGYNSAIIGATADSSYATVAIDAVSTQQGNVPSRNSTILGARVGNHGSIRLQGSNASVIGASSDNSGIQLRANHSTIIGSRANDESSISVRGTSSSTSSTGDAGFVSLLGVDANSWSTISVSARNATVIGSLAGKDSTDNVGGGANIRVSGKFGTVIGSSSNGLIDNNAKYGTVIGSAAVDRGTVATYGELATVLGSTNSVSGDSATKTSKYTTVIGSDQVEATGDFSAVIGSKDVITEAKYSAIIASDPVKIFNDSDFSLIVGSEGVKNDDGTITTFIKGKHGLIAGSKDSTIGTADKGADYGVILGSENSKVLGNHGVVIGGYNSTTANNYDIAIGAYSQTTESDKAHNEANGYETAARLKIDGKTIQEYAGVATNNGIISVGGGKSADGTIIYHQIQNLAAGDVSATSTDAINGSQLYALGTVINNVSTKVDSINNTEVKSDSPRIDVTSTTNQQTNTTTYNVSINKYVDVTSDGYANKLDQTDPDKHGWSMTQTEVVKNEDGSVARNEDGSVKTTTTNYADTTLVEGDVYANGNDQYQPDRTYTGSDYSFQDTAGNTVTLKDIISGNDLANYLSNVQTTANETFFIDDFSAISGIEGVAPEKVAEVNEDGEVSLSIKQGDNTFKVGVTNIATKTDIQNIHNIIGNTNNINENIGGDTLVENINNIYEESKKHTTVIEGDNITVTEGTNVDGGKEYTVALKKDIEVDSVKVGDTVTINKNGINAGDKKITNVKAGTEDTDAVNVSQLKDEANKRIQADNNINNRINKLGSRMNKGIAGAAALAALHPMDFDPDDKVSFAAGVANYSGENAVAIGAFYRPDEKVMFNVGGTLGNGENIVNAGVSISLDRTARVTNTKTAMARDIIDLKEQVATLTNLVHQLTGVSGQARDMFPDVPENHWAYEYVKGLVDSGVLVAYPDGLFDGERPGTRYEFAAMLYRAMNKGIILPDRVAKEFAPEIGRFRVDRIHGADDDNHKIERIRVNGDHNYGRDNYGSKNPQPVTSRGPQYPESERISK